MAKFFVPMIILAHVVTSVHCCRTLTGKTQPQLPSSNDNGSPISLPPLPYDHDNTPSISVPPSLSDHGVPSVSPSPSLSDHGVPSVSPSPSLSDQGGPSVCPLPSSYENHGPSVSPSPLLSDQGGPSVCPLPSSYDNHGPSVSPSPSSYDNCCPTSQPPFSAGPALSPSSPSSWDGTGKQTNQTPPSPSHISLQTFRNVLDYEAKGNGQDDDSQAFKDAWEDACRSHSSSGVYVPGGRTYKLLPMTLSGPCNSDITIQIDGELVAPEEPSEWGCRLCYIWIVFDRVDGLTIQGSGTLDGRGSAWWRKSFCREQKRITDCNRKPTALDIGKSNNVLLRDLTFKDSPQMHIVIKHSSYVYVTNLTIHAPGDSPNTDGIHIQNSEHVHVSDCDIGTGDDCISISAGTSDIYVQGIQCGPGHGISVGSLGKEGAKDRVKNIHVKDVHFRGSQNGVRIKTWQGGRGYAKNIIFEDITCDRVRNPIIIDQFYCPHERCMMQQSAVQISNVTYSNIKGTSFTRKAIELECSPTRPCKDIVLKDINLHWMRRHRWTLSSCWNVQGLMNGNISPNVPCLKFDDKLSSTQ